MGFYSSITNTKALLHAKVFFGKLLINSCHFKRENDGDLGYSECLFEKYEICIKE